jgi:uncharacterized protein YggT (Ycf19 family)
MNVALVVLRILDLALDVLQWIIFVWVVLSWLVFFLRNSKFRWRNRRFYGFMERASAFLDRFLRPLLRPIRRWMRGFTTGVMDWSPMVLILLILVLRQVLRAISYRLILTAGSSQ